ncbi:hypothetical protein L7F22_064315 [Adiantum nelumboides]|nr:hypothetical protein [Adiantum nelumboides]
MRELKARVFFTGKENPAILERLEMEYHSSAKEETSATNENIDDGTNAQALTYLDIQALKEAGIEGKDIVQKQKEGSTSFAQRTAWSQQKYTLKKEAKHLRLFTPIPSTLTTLARYYFEKDSEKVRGLRFDALAHTLSFAGIAPGGRYLVVDGVGGLLAGAMLERMGGEGRLLALNDADSPPAFDLLSHFNLPSQVVDPVLRSLHWASIDEGWSPAHGTPTTSSTIPQTAMSEPITTPTVAQLQIVIDNGCAKGKQPSTVFSSFERLFKGEWDALVICCGYEPTSIVERLLPKLAGSANIVIHSPFVQPLIEAHARLRLLPNLINVSVSEPWLRKYQVLPGRMHPEMMTSSTGGAILHAVRVYTEDEAKDQRRSSLSNQETAAEDGRKRRRVDVIA